MSSTSDFASSSYFSSCYPFPEVSWLWAGIGVTLSHSVNRLGCKQMTREAVLNAVTWLTCGLSHVQDHKALLRTTAGMKDLHFLRFDGCSVSTIGAYRLLKCSPHNKLQCWRDGELLAWQCRHAILFSYKNAFCQLFAFRRACRCCMGVSLHVMLLSGCNAYLTNSCVAPPSHELLPASWQHSGSVYKLAPVYSCSTGLHHAVT